MLSLEEYSEDGTQPFNTRLETLLGLPYEPRQGVPRTPVRAAAQEHVGRGRESQRWSLLFSLKTITSRTRIGDV